MTSPTSPIRQLDFFVSSPTIGAALDFDNPSNAQMIAAEYIAQFNRLAETKMIKILLERAVHDPIFHVAH